MRAPPAGRPNPRTGGRPSQETAGTNPSTEQAPLYFWSSVCALPSRVACPRSLTQLVVRRWPAGLWLWLLFSFPNDPRPGQPSSASLARACPFCSTVMVIDDCVSEVTCGTLEGALSWIRGRFYDDVGSARQCANAARIALPLSMVLVLACCLPGVTLHPVSVRWMISMESTQRRVGVKQHADHLAQILCAQANNSQCVRSPSRCLRFESGLNE